MPSKKTKILHLITGLEIGGAEVMLANVLPRLAEFDHLVCSLSTKGALGEKMEVAGIRVYALGTGKHFSPGAILAFKKIIARERPDIISTRLIHADLFGRLFGRLFGIKKIVSCLESVLDDDKYKKFFLLERLTSRLVSRYIAVSQAVKKAYVRKAKLDPERIEVIYNGIDLARFQVGEDKTAARGALGLPADAPLIGYVAKLRPERNHHNLLQAFALLAPRRPAATLLLVGDGPEKENLMALAKELKIDSQVRFLGNRDDVPRILKALDVFVSISHYEGMSIAILEAMASGLPIVASDIEPNRELIDDGVNGLLVNQSEPQKIAEKISDLINNPQKRDEFAGLIQKKSTNFSIQKTADQLDRLYKNFL